MKHLEVRQKYSAARRIFNSLLGVSSGDETLRLMFDILLEEFYPRISAGCYNCNALFTSDISTRAILHDKYLAR